ncbi:MAG: hypothetical protein K6G87_05480 [Butyrivibrio sp.]|uniref:hypothetical protein n=1 Tax=Butyrivibrio sp. TaxID=28121 RepID=UPI0025CD947C|nr:hypothetical protein [Butyrivibrio sp.]MCR5770673.1 hypothetical protein [Butyrivibrio sp.]
MLGKLIKYDLKAIFRNLLPLCIAFIIVGIVAGISFPYNIEDDNAVGFLLLWGIMVFALVVMTIAVSVISLIIVVMRFYKNLLGNEGYLSFTLPVSTGSLLASKCISGYISFLFAFVSGVITYVSFAEILVLKTGSQEAINDINNVFIEWIQDIVTSPFQYITLDILVMITGSFIFLTRIYFSIILGNLSSNHKLIVSFGSYIVVSVLESIIKYIVSEAMESSYDLSNLSSSYASTETFTIIINIIFIVVYLFGTYYFMNNKLNLE